MTQKPDKSEAEGAENGQSEAIPSLISISDVARLLGIHRTLVFDTLTAASHNAVGKLPARTVLRNLFGALQAKITQARAKPHVERRQEAEAKRADIELAKLEGSLIPLEDFQHAYADTIAKGVQNISNLPGLTKAQKESVFAAIRDAGVPKLEPRSEPACRRPTSGNSDFHSIVHDTGQPGTARGRSLHRERPKS